MKMRELNQKSPEDLTLMLTEKRARKRELEFLVHQGKHKNVKEIGAARKDIARILGLLKTGMRATNKDGSAA